jgi:hypothetical protein
LHAITFSDILLPVTNKKQSNWTKTSPLSRK